MVCMPFAYNVPVKVKQGKKEGDLLLLRQNLFPYPIFIVFIISYITFVRTPKYLKLFQVYAEGKKKHKVSRQWIKKKESFKLAFITSGTFAPVFPHVTSNTCHNTTTHVIVFWLNKSQLCNIWTQEFVVCVCIYIGSIHRQNILRN